MSEQVCAFCNTGSTSQVWPTLSPCRKEVQSASCRDLVGVSMEKLPACVKCTTFLVTLFEEVSDRSMPGSRRCLDLLWSRVPVWGPSISEEACGNCGKFFSCEKWNSCPEPRFSGVLKRGLCDHELDSKLHETAAQKAGVRSLPCFINV